MIKQLKDIFEESIKEGREIGGYIKYNERTKTFSFSKQKGSRSHIIMVPPVNKQFDFMFHTHPFKSKDFGKQPDSVLLKKIENHLMENNINSISNILNRNIIQLHPPSPDDLKYSIFMSKIYKNVPSIIVAQEGIYVIMPQKAKTNSVNGDLIHSSLVDLYYKSIWGIPYSRAQRLSDKNVNVRLNVIHRVTLYVASHTHKERLTKYIDGIKRLTGRDVLFLKFN